MAVKIKKYLYIPLFVLTIFFLYRVLSGDISAIGLYLMSSMCLSMEFDKKDIDNELFHLRNRRSYHFNKLMENITKQIYLGILIKYLKEIDDK